MMHSIRWNTVIFPLKNRLVSFFFIFLFGTFYIAIDLNAQEEKPVVLELPSDWEKGETYRIERIKEREGFEDDEITFYGSGRSVIRAEVVDKGEEYYVFKWVVEKSEILEGTSAAEGIDQVMNLIEGVEFEFRTDASGTPERLENPDQHSAYMKEIFDKALQTKKRHGATASLVEKVREALEPLLQPESLEILLMREPQLFYMPSGGSFLLGVPREYETLLPNPYGGKPFPAKGHYLLKDINSEANFAILSWKQSLDEAEAQRIMDSTLKEMLERMDKPIPSEEMLSQAMEINDSAQFIYDLETGLPSSIIHERTTVIQNIRRVDRLTFNIIPMEKND
ncbi:MAG: hypothetical protein ACYTG7_08245 [Planctomycetota bacterium]|jgi:hypothetical protein